MVNIIEKNILNSTNSISNINIILNNDILDNKFEIYKSDYLFLLIGTNPLPNYVAFKLLAKPSTHIFLVHTDETNQVADRLSNVLNLPPDRFTKIKVDEANTENIYSKTMEFAKGKRGIGLNYTGGTKSMAVHSYRAIMASDQGAIFSYLNARNLEMFIGTHDSSRSETIGLFPRPSLKEILALHGFNQYKVTMKPYHPEICQVMITIPHKELRSWCDNNLHCGEGTHIKKGNDLKPVLLPFNPPFDKLAIYYQDCRTLEDMVKKWQWEGGIKGLAGWLDGKWLEHYTLWASQQIETQSNIHEMVLGLEIKVPIEFELDIAALKGYQLFAISCTTDSNKGMLKLKLFEAYVRANQLGGDEAKIGLVCFAPSEKCDQKNNPTMITKEIEEEWDLKNKFRVFGAEHILDLPKHLNEWFKSSII